MKCLSFLGRERMRHRSMPQDGDSGKRVQPSFWSCAMCDVRCYIYSFYLSTRLMDLVEQKIKLI